MSRRAGLFTQAAVARALRAAEQVAPGKLRVRISPAGEIVIEPAPKRIEEAQAREEKAFDPLERGWPVVP